MKSLRNTLFTGENFLSSGFHRFRQAIFRLAKLLQHPPRQLLHRTLEATLEINIEWFWRKILIPKIRRQRHMQFGSPPRQQPNRIEKRIQRDARRTFLWWQTSTLRWNR